MLTVHICVRVVLEELARHTHCNSAQQVDSYGRTARGPGRRKESMALSGHLWKELVTVVTSTVVETGATGPVVAVRVADQPGMIEVPGVAALQMLSTRHLFVVHMQTVKD